MSGQMCGQKKLKNSLENNFQKTTKYQKEQFYKSRFKF